MPTREERLQAIERGHQTLEQEHAQLKKTIELHTIAIGALVDKTTLEKLNEKYDKIFETLIAHDSITNERLGEIQNQLIEQDGKIVGQQTEMRQGFEKITELDGKILGQQTEMRQRFELVNTALLGQQFDMRQAITETRQRFEKMDQRFEKIEATMATKEESVAMENRINEKFDKMLDAFQQLVTTVETRLPPPQS